MNSTEAMAAYKKALELDADNEDAMTGLATVYADLGDNKAAADMLRKVADKDPNPRSLTSLANVYEQLKDYSLAAEMLRRALDQQPGNSELKHALAEDLLFSDQLDDSLKLYQEAIGRRSQGYQGRITRLADLPAKAGFRQSARSCRQSQGDRSFRSGSAVQRRQPAGVRR